MSDLRKQLENASRDYHAAKYPGDLFADINRSRGNGHRWMIAACGLAAMAACVVILISMQSHLTQPKTIATNLPTKINQPANTTAAPATSTASADTDEYPSWSAMGGSLVPSVESITPVAWSVVPSADTFAQIKETTSTTQESL